MLRCQAPGCLAVLLSTRFVPILLAGLLLGRLGCAVAAVAPRSPEFKDLLDQGIDARRGQHYQNSLEILERARKLAQHENSPSEMSDALGFLALTAAAMGNYRYALQLHLEELAIVRSTPDLRADEEPWVLGSVAGDHARLHDLPQAIDFARQSVAAQTKSFHDGDEVGMGRQRQRLGILLYLARQYSEAEQVLRAAYADFEVRVRRTAELGRVPQATYDFELGVLRWLERTLVAEGRTDQALETVEGRRSRFLATLVPPDPRQPKAQAAPEEIHEVAQIKAAAKKHGTTLVEYSLVYVYDPDLLLEFSGFVEARPEAIYIWLIKPDETISFVQVTLPQNGPALDQLITDARGAIGARGRGVERTLPVSEASGRQTIPALRMLDRLLIEPIEAALPTDAAIPIMFVPQDTLFQVPFAALQAESGGFFVQKHTLLVGLSAAGLDPQTHSAAGRDSAPQGVLVVGNPSMPSLPGRQGRAAVPLPPLPSAELEARAIAGLYATQPLIGKEATKANVTARMPSARILHFATHGLLDRDEGEYFNSLALAPSSTDSGFLQAREISKMNLAAELAVLSACDTGDGKLTGDGVLGLSSAFTTAGVPSIVVALWSIPDAPTAQLMTTFYKTLQQSGDKAQALRSAMLTTMQGYPQPGDWAAFELIGSNVGSDGLRLAKGDSVPANAETTGAAFTLPVPRGSRNYAEHPSTDVAGGTSANFMSDLSLDALTQFYRDAFRQRGLVDDPALTRLEKTTAQLAFTGPWPDRELIAQFTCSPGEPCSVSLGYAARHR